MRALYFWLIVALGAAASEPAATAEPRTAVRLEAAVAAGPIDAALFTEAVLIHVNAARQANGRAPVAADGRLTATAARQAEAMARAGAMTHRAGGALRARLSGEGVQFRKAGENIAMEPVYAVLGRPISTRSSGCSFVYADTGAAAPRHSYASLARSTVARWMASPGHRKNILEPGFRRMGAGFAVKAGGALCGDVYLAQVFAG